MGSATQLDATFAALADPTRRAILARLALGETTVGFRRSARTLRARIGEANVPPHDDRFSATGRLWASHRPSCTLRPRHRCRRAPMVARLPGCPRSGHPRRRGVAPDQGSLRPPQHVLACGADDKTHRLRDDERVACFCPARDPDEPSRFPPASGRTRSLPCNHGLSRPCLSSRRCGTR